MVKYKNGTNPDIPTVYFKSLTIENLRCFKGTQTIDFTKEDGSLANWTVILGNNNMGKTTILRCLQELSPEELNYNKPNSTKQVLAYLPNVKENDFFYTPHSIQWRTGLDCSFFIKNHKKTFIRNYGLINSSEFPDLKDVSLIRDTNLSNFKIYPYGIHRKTIDSTITESETKNANPFTQHTYLVNSEEWLLQTDYAVKNGNPKAQIRLDKIKILLTDILPDVHDFKFVTDEQFNNSVEAKTDFGWVRINELGYGYQSLIAWVVDLAKRLFDRYPNSENPLAEAAVVLVDEISLHLHPEWQRKIIPFLSDHFPNTQFIATTHSPLIVQSANDINLVILEKEGDHVIIKQPKIKNYNGWTVEEILTELMGLDERVYSETYLKLIQQFDEALDEDNYDKAKTAYDELDKILHPTSGQRKLLRIQMSSLIPH